MLNRWLKFLYSVTQTLLYVDLSRNKIGERGGKEIAAALAVQPPITTLLLNNNKYVGSFSAININYRL